MRGKLSNLLKRYSGKSSVSKKIGVSSFSRKNVVGDDKAFYVKLNDNLVVGVAHSVKELKKVLKTCDSNVFSFHVRSGRNDFSAWVKGVFKDSVLFNKLNDCKNLEEVIKVL